MVKARGMSCGGRSRFAGSGLAGSGWAARRFLRSAHQVSKWSTQAWMVKVQVPSWSTVKLADQRSLGSAVMGDRLPVGSLVVFVEQAGGDVVVAVGEDGGGDVDVVAEDAAGGVAATIDLGLDLFDDDALTAFGRFHLIPVHHDTLNFTESKFVAKFNLQMSTDSLHLTEELFRVSAKDGHP